MAYFYEGSCAACGFLTTFVAEWRAVRTRMGTVEVLPHPGESYRLEQLGFTWAEARSERRLLYFHAGACATCGARSDLDSHDPRVLALRGSPWPGRLFVAGGVVFVGLVEVALWVLADETRWPWLFRLTAMPGLGILAVLLYFMLASSVSDTVDRCSRAIRRFFPRLLREREMPPSGIPCTLCESGQVYPLGHLPPRAFPCPRCAAAAYRYSVSQLIS